MRGIDIRPIYKVIRFNTDNGIRRATILCP